MAKLKVIWAPEAAEQVKRIFYFYNTRNGNTKYSQNLRRMIKDTLRLIAIYPYMYPQTTYNHKRYFVCEYFKIFYSVHIEFIAVEAVFDTRQDSEKAPFR